MSLNKKIEGFVITAAVALLALMLAGVMVWTVYGAATDVRYDDASGRCTKNCLGISDPGYGSDGYADDGW